MPTNGGHLWAERFDRDLTDIFSMQDEVVEKIVGALAVTLTKGEEQRLHRRGTSNVEAYESWLRARELLARGTRKSIAEGRRCTAGRSRSIRISRRRMPGWRSPPFRNTPAAGPRTRRRRWTRRSDGRGARSNWTRRSR